ncbi:DUF6173 family protein [Sedimentitalea arenosa]|uniref:Uncharacterized protein n=1 Tax=Sedimentitalea arenosa TaxID=2798803 RepID=A0A8J7IPK4_9RHOB|nr:DUF6173 family protein [Arenibacterium arenosum]MBJ6371266.1 hypothetical protein [Arenibacterium arenosum]
MDEKISTTAEAIEADVLPKMREVHADPDDCAGPSAVPNRLKQPVDGKSPAQWAYERLILYIQNFEQQLDAEHEVAMGFAGGDAGVLRIQGLGYYDPDIVTFYGTDASGVRTQLVQHVSQLSVLLRALPKPLEDAPATRIGFRLAAGLEED